MTKKQNKNCATNITHYGEDYHKPICPKCHSSNLITGAGKKTGQMNLKCGECKAFIGYRNLEKLKKLRRQKQLTPCLQLLEQENLTGDTAIFLLSTLGGAK
jgi:hypothetical protein